MPSQTNKFKGLLNDGMQIKGSFSEDGKFVISGSEDGQVRFQDIFLYVRSIDKDVA